ncbi:hypothetical protein ACG9XY_12355 [Acinetobacter seifertii]|uniref:hypothetical protein n=1 Tax=Acinetobacter calcoaceticus/baumannii complex TaxID=909768 RepID=UPI00294026B0|nr:hypothetical protein [Acinetobacter seifertii]MDV4263312.1 hypothetical protein [Acinetobacter seifertii]
MPLDMAIALIDDERLDNTHQGSSRKSNADLSKSNATKSEETIFVSKKRKHSQEI